MQVRLRVHHIVIMIENICQALDDTGFTYNDYSSYVTMSCPFAAQTHRSKTDNNPSLYIRESGDWHCFSCKYGSDNLADFFDLYAKNNKLPEGFNWEHFRLLTLLDLPKSHRRNPILLESVLDHFESAKKCEQYLRSRKFPLESIERFDLKFDQRNDRLVFPVRDCQGKLKGLTGRSINPNIPKQYRHYHYLGFDTSLELLNAQNLNYDSEGIVVLEGMTDLLKCYQYCDDLNLTPVSTFSCTMSERQAATINNMCLGMTHILWDCEESGYNARKRLKKDGYLGGLVVDHKWNGTDVGAMDREEFCRLFKKD